MKNLNVKVWECKIIVPENADLPNGFDYPLRRAVIAAVELAGIEVLGCSSGWGGELTDSEKEAFRAKASDIYFTGVIDADDLVLN